MEDESKRGPVRIVALVACLVVTVFAVAACGDDENEPTDNSADHGSKASVYIVEDEISTATPVPDPAPSSGMCDADSYYVVHQGKPRCLVLNGNDEGGAFTSVDFAPGASGLSAADTKKLQDISAQDGDGNTAFVLSNGAKRPVAIVQFAELARQKSAPVERLS